MKKQQYVTEKKVCILCNKKNHKHSEKLLQMHETALLRGSKGKKLASLQIGFGPERPAYITELNADPPYNKEYYQIWMHCTECKRAMGDSEVDMADMLDEMCIECFCEETDQRYSWY